ncbi:MAG: HD domain-containing protein [Candidatus Hodarchaeota archaeon]
MSEYDQKNFIDTPFMQRLKRIRHAPADAVYPSCTHTRFTHSLGVMQLGITLFDKLVNRNILDTNIIEDIQKYRNTVKYACLLHDIGHTPLSHICEGFGDNAINAYETYIKPKGIVFEEVPTGSKHEWASCAISVECFHEELQKQGVDLELFCRMICGIQYQEQEKAWLNPLIYILNSWTDVDKIDYLLRDGHMSGAKLAVLDYDRLLSAFSIYNNEIYVSKQGFSIISQLVHGRDSLYLWLYTHHAVSYYGSLIQRYIEHLISVGKNVDLFSLKALINGADDYQLYSHLRQCFDTDDPLIKILHNQIFNRNFYKALWKTPFECEDLLGSLPKKKLVLNCKKFELDIINKFNLPPNSVFIYEAKFKIFEEAATDIWVCVGDKKENFTKYFNESVYAKICKRSHTPYIRIKRDLYSDTLKKEIIKYIKSGET